MPLQLTGVQFVNNGLSSTLSGLNQYNVALVKTSQTVLTATKNINTAYTNIANNTVNKFSLIGNLSQDFSKNMNTAHTGVLRFTGGIKNLLLAMSGFILLKRLINDVFDAFRNLWGSMVEGASNTELLKIRFENLMAISIQNTQGVQDYGTALSMAKGPANDLLDWVNIMSAKTMFGRDEIANVLGLGMAFDMTAGQSQTLTMAMVDWASGMGLGQDALQRMVVNFGQMMRMGKITQRELRDLAIGGLFPVNEALTRIGEKAGLSGDALKKFMSDTATSGVPVNALLTEFVEIAGEKFPDAGIKMAQTWKGVTQNIKDFVTTILGAAVLGPTMNKIVEKLSRVLDQALSPAVRGAANVIGENLLMNLEKLGNAAGKVIKALQDIGKAFGIPVVHIQDLIAAVNVFVNYISKGMEMAASSVQEWLNTTGNTFAQGAQQFLKWGMEMVTQFAIGIVQGATTVLSWAMNILSGILAFFLGPGSPPRVAPEIDVWGQSAMNEFLKGMTKADFDILKDLQGPIKAALDVMAQLGLIAQESVGKVFYDVSKQIIAAMNQMERTGKVSESVFKAIRKAGGELGDELEQLARLQFALLAATKELEKAQRALNDARKADSAAAKRVDELTQEYRDLVDAGASKDVLNAKRAEIKAAMDAHDQTREDVILAEEKVEAAEDALEPLREAVELQEQMIQQMISLAQAQAQAQKGAGAGGGVGGDIFGAMGDALKEFDANMETTKVKMAIAQVEFENKIDAMTRRIQAKLGEIFAPLKEKWDAEISPAIDKITGSFNRLSDNVERIFGKISGPDSGAGKFVKILGEIVGALLGFRVLRYVFSPIISIFTTISKNKVAMGILSGLPKVLLAIGTALSGTSVFVIGAVAGIIAFVAAMIFNIGGLRDKVVALWNGWILMMGALYNAILRFFERIINKVVEGLNIVIGWFTSKGETLKKDWDSFWDKVKEKVETIFNAITTFLGNAGTAALTALTTAFAPLKEKWDEFWGGLKDFASNVFEGAEGLVIKIGEWIGGVADTILQGFEDLFAEDGLLGFIPDFLQFGKDIVQGIIDGIAGMVTDLANAFAKLISDALPDPGGGIPFIPGVQSGGLIKKRGIYELAEAGPELVIPAKPTSQFLRALKAMNSIAHGRVSAPPVFSGATSNSYSRTYNLNMSTMKSSGQVVHDFAIMETLAG